TLAPCRLGEWPTPLGPAPALARALGLAELALKREDRASQRYGGNKVRGLEFLLAGASPGTVFVTGGGTGSTHCLATAVHAAAAGGRAALAQFPQPVTPLSEAVATACEQRAALVVRVAPIVIANRWRTLRLAHAARRLLAHRGVPLPAPCSLEIVDRLGEGYGHPTSDGEAARRLASEHGLTLDSTYGAKAFGLLMRRGTWNVQRVVFWHTFAVP